MKRILAFCLAILCFVCITSCAGNNAKANFAKVTLPWYVVSLSDINTESFDIENYIQQTGYVNAQLNEDLSLTITMTQEQYQEELNNMRTQVEDACDQLTSENECVIDITKSEDYSEITIFVDGEAYEYAWFIPQFAIGIPVIIYQAVLGIEIYTEISVIDIASNDVLLHSVLPNDILPQ